MFYLIIFFMTKKGTWDHNSRDQSVLDVLRDLLLRLLQNPFSTQLFACRNICSTFVNKGELSKLK